MKELAAEGAAMVRCSSLGDVDPIPSVAGSGSSLEPVRNRKLFPFRPDKAWLTQECASVFAFVECKTMNL